MIFYRVIGRDLDISTIPGVNGFCSYFQLGYLELEFPSRIGNFKRRSRSGERSFGFVSANMDWQVSHTSFKPGSEQARDARGRCILSSESPPSVARELGLLAIQFVYTMHVKSARDMKYHRR